ncbi:MAG TPA: YciI family protein [Casimicrobiaceae bacterium]|nr:YciI family protein [Casimicrobiaceae bacterium]
MTFPRTMALALLVLAGMMLNPDAATAQPTGKMQQFVYVLRLTPKYHDQARWTDKDNAAVGRHFERLSKGVEAGYVVFAGRTREPLDKTFGLVVFEAESESAARAFMESDPAVEAGVMTATLHPYALALQRKN